ncbi:hypothetical protein HD600_001930 [Microbacterium ginsengiterrae]|uniref:LPXTG-motif cell wall-anchored protein n=1 Tax=Microbacterium ginsengiterrae TaxID=546115 RepID=A0A7W9CDD5_9MICO|nr:hypothetical protein [Microbacterium ginsengiterrae]MBB5743433.1 hypothetical protein [Microbacterium ginsengiterrae]
MARDGWNRRRALGAVITAAMLSLGLASVSVQSFAAMTEASDAVAGDLVVTAEPQPTEFFDMSPGDRRHWSIEANLLGAERGSLALRVYGAGSLIAHPHYPLTIQVDGCEGTLVGDDPRVQPSCDGGEFTPIIAEQPLAGISSEPHLDTAEDVWALPDILRDRTRSFVVTLAVPSGGADDKTLQGLRGEIGVGLYSAGGGSPQKPVTQEPENLAKTGGLMPISLALIAAGTIGLGMVLSRVHSARRTPTSGRQP